MKNKHSCIETFTSLSPGFFQVSGFVMEEVKIEIVQTLKI